MPQDKAHVSAIKVEQVLIPPVRHPIKAARLLYSAPTYILRGPIYLIFIILFVALIYSFWAKKDMLVIAPLILERESTTVEAIGSGLVQNVLVSKDQFVRIGEPLLVIQEQTRISMNPEQETLKSKLYTLQKEYDKIDDEYGHQISQIELDLNNLSSNTQADRIAKEGRVAQIKAQLKTAQRSQITAQRALNTAVRAAKDLDKDYQLAKKQLDRAKVLFDNRDMTATQFESIEKKERKAWRTVLDAKANIRDAETKISDIETQIAGIRVSLHTAETQLKKLLDLSNKDKLERELAQLNDRRKRDLTRISEQMGGVNKRIKESENLVAGVTFQENVTNYSSNFAGLITDIHVRKGQIVGLGAPLVTIVKESAPLEGRILVHNQDIGRLVWGQQVQIKYFAYPYQEWGIRKGKISAISTKPSGIKGHESKYIVRTALFQESIVKPGMQPRLLEIGLEGMAEIKTGEKRIIELLFSPVSKFFTDPDED